MITAFNLPPVQSYRPATFKERGVAAPFTAPLLAGARVRRGQRHRVELIVPNPSGGRGVYVLPWTSVRTLLRPTVYDNRLNQRIGGLAAITPSDVRQAGLEIASLGLAGRRAMETAIAAIRMDTEDRRITSCLLLIALAARAEPSSLGSVDGHARPSLELERRAEKIIARTAHRFEQPPQEILAAVGALAEVLAPSGLPTQTSLARIPRLIKHLATLRTDLVDWAQEHAEDTRADLADVITGFTDIAITVAEVALARTQAMASDVVGLLRTWSRSPQHIIDTAARPEWLLDGWEQVCQLWWSSPTAEQRRAVMTEMAQLVPVLPRETSDWVSAATEPDYDMLSQAISLNEDWRTGAALALTARNERVRAFPL